LRRASTRLVCLLVAIAAALATAASAHASPTIDAAGSNEFPERAYTLRAQGAATLTPEDVSVTENGVRVDGVEVESAAAAASDAFGSVLVIDASNSMEGRPIAEAMRAARAFAARRTPEQQLGVVTFNGGVDVLLPLTSDSASIDTALAELPELAPSTHLRDGIDAAVTMLRDAGIDAGSVVVLSDGADNGSTTSVDDVVEGAEAAGIKVFGVGLRSAEFDPATLRELVVGGSFASAATPGDLEPILDRFGVQVASQHLIRYRSPVEPGTQVTVEVEVAGLPGVARDEYTAPAVAATPAKADGTGFWASPAAMVAAILVAASLLGLALFGLLRPQPETPRERLARFLPGGGFGRGDDRPDGALRETGSDRGLLGLLGRVLDGREWWTRFQEIVPIAGIEVPPIRIVAMTLGATLIAALLLVSVLGAPVFVPLALGVPLGVRAWIRRKLLKRRREFADQLADNLQLVTSALRAGQSMAGALGVVVEEASEPARTEFRRIVNDESLGVPLEDAIRDVGRRMDNRDLEQVALVATIQRQTGGNTAEVLDRVIETIRERVKLRRLMETLTAQGRLSQVIVSLLPLVLILVIAVLNKDFLRPLFETNGGRIALAIGAGLSITGSLIIKRIVEVRV
jgi:tight adherence protein B